MQERVDVGTADEVEHLDPAVDHRDRAALTRLQGDRLAERAQAVAMGVVDVAHRRGRRGGVELDLALIDRVPDLALVGAGLAPGDDVGAGATALHSPHPWVGRLRRGTESLAVPATVPAAAFHAADRDRDLRTGGDQGRDVEDAVLLGAEDLLPLVEQHRLRAGVVDEQVIDRGAALELADRRLRVRVGEGDVLETGNGAEQRIDREGARDVGLADLDRRGEVGGQGLVIVACGCHG